MKRIIAGGTGLIGQQLVHHWLQQNHQLIVIGRSEKKIKKLFPTVTPCSWQKFAKEYQPLCDQCDVIINLAGANIGEKLWSEKRKQLIVDSRVNATKTVANALVDLTKQQKSTPRLLNAGAIGIYGLQKNQADGLPPPLDETTAIDFNEAPDFLAKVGRAWEQATEVAKKANVSVVNMRFGVVLAKSGGVLKKMALPFYVGLGGTVGSGQQPFTWIHINDLIRAMDFIIAHPELNGPINMMAPNTISQRHLAKSLGGALNRPVFMPTPAFALKIIFGQMAEELLLHGQHGYPKRLLDQGFAFDFPTIDQALTNIYS